jgi:hypothetical protein
MTIKTYTLEEQLRICAKYEKQAVYRTACLLNRCQNELLALSTERMIPGYDEYQDVMFHQSLSELERETREELADALNRQKVYSWREAQEGNQ